MIIKQNFHFEIIDIDGARLFNAASSLNCNLRDITTSVGADILSLGGTKVNI
jgi:threonine aldolase